MRTLTVWTIAALWLALSPFSFAAEPSKTVALTQIVEHPSLDAARRGIFDELADAGFVTAIPGLLIQLYFSISQTSIFST